MPHTTHSWKPATIIFQSAHTSAIVFSIFANVAITQLEWCCVIERKPDMNVDKNDRNILKLFTYDTDTKDPCHILALFEKIILCQCSFSLTTKFPITIYKTMFLRHFHTIHISAL